MFWIWKERVAELERKISAVQQEIQAMQGRGQLLSGMVQSFPSKSRDFLSFNLQKMKQR